MIVERIKKLCVERGTTLAEVERSVGLGNGVIRRWDELSPRTDNLMKVAEFFGVTLDSLAREDG